MSNITRSTPYLATGAPTSPMLLAVAGLLVALAAAVAARLGFEIPADASTTTAVAGVLAALVGFVQHRLARREQVAGVVVLDETLAEALAEPPPPPEALSESVERLRARAAGLAPPPHAPRRDTIPTADEQLHLLDPSKRLGLDPHAGKALRRVLAGEIRGAEGPIAWRATAEPQAPGTRVEIDGVVRWAAAGDEQALARALGAELWLEAEKNASADAGRPDVPSPRPRSPSGALFGSALLGDDGEPVSAGDLDSGEIPEDPDPDQRTSEAT